MAVGRRWAFVVIALLLAGCFGGQGGKDPEPRVDAVTIRGIVLSEADRPISGVKVELQSAGTILARSVSDDTGAFSLSVNPVEDCELVVAYGPKPQTFPLGCARDGTITVRLDAAGKGGLDVVDGAPGSRPGPAAVIPVHGVVREGSGGRALEGIIVEAIGASTATSTTNRSGAFRFDLVPGAYVFTMSPPCFQPHQTAVDLVAPRTLDLVLYAVSDTVPMAPAGVRAVPGPGAGQVTVTWDKAAQTDPCGTVHRYELWRGEQPSALSHFLTLGNSQAVADSSRGEGPAQHYAVRAVSRSGLAGPLSATVTAAPPVAAVPGIAVGLRAPSHNPVEALGQLPFPVWDANGTPRGERSWRVVAGTGALAENYVTTTSSGRILDMGGVWLTFSDDRGLTWSEVAIPLPFTGGEGTVAGAPNGDIVAVGWSLQGDHVWAQRYSPTDDTWYYAPILDHGPFFDRPWLGVLKGPFYDGDLVIPYVTVVKSASLTAAANVILSYDGLVYQQVDQAELDLQLNSIQLFPQALAADPDRDWMQPLLSARIQSMGNGLGLYAQSLHVACGDWTVLRSDLSWACPTDAPADNDRIFVDSQGWIHKVVFAWSAPTIEYHQSKDGGATWTMAVVPMPAGWTVSQLDFKADGLHQQAAFLVQATTTRPGGLHQHFVVRYDTTGDAPRFVETLILGKGDVALGSTVGNTGSQRYDFADMAFLPDGKIVASFADSTSRYTQLAIEL